MRNISIFTDSCSDIPDVKNIKEIKVLPLYCYLCDDDTEYGDEIDLPMEVFYNKLKDGIPKTSSVNVVKANQLFEEELDNGNDIICISMSSKLSGTYNNVFMAASDLKAKYKDSKITVIDSLTGSFAEGLITLKALEKKNAGCSYEEIVSYIEKYKQYYNIEFFVDDLSYLQKGGRISKTTAFVGQTLNIKPLIYVKDDGATDAVDNVKGTKARDRMLLERLADRFDESIGTIGILHSNNLEAALRLENGILKLGLRAKLIIAQIGPIIGSHIGSGAYGLTYPTKILVKK